MAAMRNLLQRVWRALPRRRGLRGRYPPVGGAMESRCLLSNAYLQTNLVADQAGVAKTTDPGLINAWGLSYFPGGPFWVSDNGSGLTTVYDSAGTNVGPTVTIAPPPGSAAGTQG